MTSAFLREYVQDRWSEFKEGLNRRLTKYLDQSLRAAKNGDGDKFVEKLLKLVTEVAYKTIDEDTGKQKWLGGVRFLSHCMKSKQPNELMFVSRVLDAVPNVFGTENEQHAPDVKEMFAILFKQQCCTVRAVAFGCFVTFVTENDGDRRLIKTMAPLMSQVVEICHSACYVENGGEGLALHWLAELEKSLPKLINPHLREILIMCLSGSCSFCNSNQFALFHKYCSMILIARLCAFNVTKDSNYRQLAIKVLAAICEKSTAQLKKHYSVSIEFILAAVLHLMTNLTLDPGVWLDEGDIGGENQEPTVEVAADVLGRISCALKGKAMMKPLLFLVNKMRICVDWRERHAALAGFSAILEGCEKQIEPQAEQYVREILPYLQDKHPRVRHAACHAISSMSSYFASKLQTSCHDTVIPALVNAVKDLSCARVSMSAISALDDFMVDGPNEIFFTHFRAIMDAYIQALAAALYRLQTIGKTSYCEKVIFAMGLMAEAIQDRFTEFYDAIVPHLLRILMTCKAEHEKILRGKAMESLAMIGIAVGKEKFHDDWIVVVELFKKEMPTITFEDPLYMYYTDSCARICKVVGKDFASYLPLIMNYALQMAAYKPQIAIVDEDKAKQDDPVWTYRKIGENFYGISSAGLDEKADTCSWLMQYAKNLEEAFLPYVDKVAKLCVNNLQFFFMDTVRCNAAITMPYLLGCVKGQGVAAMRQLWKKFYSALKNLLAREDEVEVIESIFDAFQESVPFLGADGLAKGEAAEIVALFSHQLRQHEKRRLGYDAERGDEDHDGSKEFRKEMEMEVLARISELLHNLFEVFGEWLFEHVVPAFPNFLQLIDPHRGYQSRQYGVCYINDCLEFAPKKCAKYQNQFVPVMLKCLSDPMPEVRQAAAYGFGVMGELGGPEYQSAVSSALQPLANVTLRADAMASEECADATGNAILAISKILKFFEKHVKLHKSLIEGSEEYKFFKALLHDHQIENMTCAMKEKGVKIRSHKPIPLRS
ncbi:hypothetical protein Y032_0161g3363 [Ancylostoma ceylanicum]|uniref:IPO4/5-like TPR repeats domain-containing protein n=1 Tax=Ancylostoma ceylanicum TaxID=53326 RepID=A0A016SYA6_9BILA|nr:hypothetical protein Y032_0161g3363 [Ancylostoma ceylanicum]